MIDDKLLDGKELVDHIRNTLKANDIHFAKIILGEYDDHRILVKCVKRRDAKKVRELFPFYIERKRINVSKMFFMESFFVHGIERTYL